MATPLPARPSYQKPQPAPGLADFAPTPSLRVGWIFAIMFVQGKHARAPRRRHRAIGSAIVERTIHLDRQSASKERSPSHGQECISQAR